MTDKDVHELGEVFLVAKRIVDAAELEESLRAVAFGRAIDALLKSGETSDDLGASPGGQGLDNLAKHGGVESQSLANIYYLDEMGTPQVGIASTSLSTDKSGGSKQLALLVAFGRQAAGVEEWTPASVIREVCKSYNKYSEKHFGGTLLTMGDAFHIRGTGAAKSLKLKQTGLEQGRALLKALTS